ncbi:MAG: NADH-quinone oxidoreductase subunit M [Candidatus Krumholzibacteria bacterium]|nr:NADH-quinone oxidoreductase subunit M [Candidatus Krumholzibacteria bacterium]MDH4336595.1 NADH-quinone oxidoreductase subunit M [Candidatus Krumholzibacteria bacterium]
MDILSLVTFLPLFAAVVVVLMPRGAHRAIKGFALLASIAMFAVSIKLVQGFVANPDMQFVVDAPWLPSLGISYHIGIDGISLFLVMLVTFITPITILGCWNTIEERVKEFFFCLLFLETAMIGAFVALDLFLFYIFWEAMLIPMYFMIGMWGGERKVYATIKFFIYTMVGSLLMLVAILYVVHQSRLQTGSLSFDYGVLLATSFSAPQQWILFLAFALAFAIKVPMFPFHTWLPDAHVEAPTPGSVILAGVLLKMGTYGFIRFAMPLFPEAALRAVPWIAGIAIIGIIYGALVAMVQKDVKKLVAYSSVSHLGFVMLGLVALNTQAVEGAILGMINHGISTGGLFLLVGVIYERRHTRLISEYGGITRVMPVYATIFMIVTLSSIGLPPLNGFVHEFLILVGAYQANPWWGILAATGVVLGAIYMLWMLQRVFFGEITNEKNKGLKDLSLREIFVFLPLLVMIFWMGIYSKPFVSRMEPAVTQFVEQMNAYRLGMDARDGAVNEAALVAPANDRTEEN